MYIRNLQINLAKHYVCAKPIAKYLIDKGFSEIGAFENMKVFNKTSELQAALKVMPFYLKFIAKLGGDIHE